MEQQTETKPANQKPKELSQGGLWKEQDRNGDLYYSGKITIEGKEVRFRAFSNRYKQDGENTPDFRVFLSKPSNGATEAPKRTVEPTGGVKTPKKVKAAPVESQEDKDVSFDD
jgi:hypothetical protein